MAIQQSADTKHTTKSASKAPQAPKISQTSASAEPKMLELALSDPLQAGPQAVLQLQRMAGNRAVRRLLASQDVQAKLTVGPADDKHEQEADRVASQVMNVGSPTSPKPVQRQNEEEFDYQDGLQRSALTGPISAVRRSSPDVADPRDGFEAGSDVERQLAGASGAGRPLPGDTRSFMESRFGSSFERVRIHTGSESDRLNRRLSAQAFTHGPDVYFAQNKYNPSSAGGKLLLAHELTHVVQQGAADGAGSMALRCKAENRQVAPLLHLNRVRVQREDDSDSDDELTPEALGAKLGTRFPMTADTQKALAAAGTANSDYTLVGPMIRAYIPESNQTKVNDVQGFFQRVTGKNKDFRDYLRAYLLKEYAVVVHKLYNDEEYTKKYTTEKAREQRRDKVYLPKALEVRDKFKPLLKKGITAPETRAFLKSEEFDEALPLDEEGKAAQMSNGPRIDVRATFIGGKILGMSVRAHLFIVYTSSEGRQVYYRGGPGEDDNTVADMGDYVPGTVDWDPSAPSKTVLSGEQAKAKADALAEATSVIDGLKVPYVGFTGVKDREGENCNATAWTILDRAGIPKQKPFGFHPGWGHVLGQALGQGTGAMAEKETDDPESGAGTPQVLKGGADTQVQLYADRAGAEKLIQLPGGTPVEMLRDTRFKEDTNFLKVRFGVKQIGFVDSEDVERRAGASYLIKGDGSHRVPVYELAALRVSGDFLAGGDSVDVVDDVTDDPKPVRIWYDGGGYMKLGRVSSAEVVKRAEPPPKVFDAAHYPAGERNIPVTAPTKFMAAHKADGPLDAEVEFYMGETMKVVVEDDLTTSQGRCKVFLFSTVYYAPLDVVLTAVEPEPEALEDPKAKYAHIANIKHRLDAPAGKKYQTYPDELSLVASEYMLDADRQLRITVFDQLKEHGRAKVDIMGTGKYFYIALDDLFDKEGKPSAAIDRFGGESSVAPEKPPEDVVGEEELDQLIRELGGEAPVKGTDVVDEPSDVVESGPSIEETVAREVMDAVSGELLSMLKASQDLDMAITSFGLPGPFKALSPAARRLLAQMAEMHPDELNRQIEGL